jgi:hypothetical protein
MGCFGSRLDKRASAATEDLNSVGLQFVGGEGVEDLFSADNFVFLQGKEGKYECLKAIYPTEAGKATDDAKATAAFTSAFKFVEKHLKEHQDLVAKDAKAGDQMVMGKFSRKDVVAQLENVMVSFKATDIEVKADAPEGETKAPEMEGAAPEMEAAAVEMEGGEEGEAAAVMEGDAPAMEAMATTDPRLAHVDDQEYKGFAETPACYLRNAIVNEYFGDLIKQRIVAIQFLGAKGESTNEDLAGAAGYLTSGLATSEKTAADAWFCGMVGELDQAALSELKKDASISFPGWVQGWTSEADAAGYNAALKAVDGKKDVSQVIFKVTGAPCVTVLGNRVVAHRLAGKCSEDAKVADGLTTVAFAATPYDERTLQESFDATKVVPVVADKAAEGEKAPEMEAPMEPPMDPPAE